VGVMVSVMTWFSFCELSGRRGRHDSSTSARRPPAGSLGHAPILPVDDCPGRVHTPSARGRRSQAQLPHRHGTDVLSSTSVPPTAAEAGDLTIFDYVAKDIDPLGPLVKVGRVGDGAGLRVCVRGPGVQRCRTASLRVWTTRPTLQDDGSACVDRASDGAGLRVCVCGSSVRRCRTASLRVWTRRPTLQYGESVGVDQACDVAGRRVCTCVPGVRFRDKAIRRCVHGGMAPIDRQRSREPNALTDPLRAALRPLAKQIDLALVYGSVAHGADRAKSDIDLLVVADDLLLEELFARLAPLEEKLGRTINPTLYTRADFGRRRRDGNPFLKRVLTGEHVVLLGTVGDDGKPR
jgi:predicted nucleotidyltransferase